jgi:hypothetical protein
MGRNTKFLIMKYLAVFFFLNSIPVFGLENPSDSTRIGDIDFQINYNVILYYEIKDGDSIKHSFDTTCLNSSFHCFKVEENYVYSKFIVKFYAPGHAVIKFNKPVNQEFIILIDNSNFYNLDSVNIDFHPEIEGELFYSKKFLFIRPKKIVLGNHRRALLTYKYKSLKKLDKYKKKIGLKD